VKNVSSSITTIRSQGILRTIHQSRRTILGINSKKGRKFNNLGKKSSLKLMRIRNITVSLKLPQTK
jgi:hypothetical protein